MLQHSTKSSLENFGKNLKPMVEQRQASFVLHLQLISTPFNKQYNDANGQLGVHGSHFKSYL